MLGTRDLWIDTGRLDLLAADHINSWRQRKLPAKSAEADPIQTHESGNIYSKASGNIKCRVTKQTTRRFKNSIRKQKLVDCFVADRWSGQSAVAWVWWLKQKEQKVKECRRHGRCYFCLPSQREVDGVKESAKAQVKRNSTVRRLTVGRLGLDPPHRPLCHQKANHQKTKRRNFVFKKIQHNQFSGMHWACRTSSLIC